VALNLALIIYNYFLINLFPLDRNINKTEHLIAQTAMLHKIIKQNFCFLFFITICVTTLSADIARLRCMWREDPTTTMVIGWDQISGYDPLFYYSTNEPIGTGFEGYATIRTPDRVVQTKGMNNHFVRLSKLTPDTQYFFKINDTEGSSKVYSFRTAPASPYTRLSVIAGGDSRNHRAGRINANKLVGKLRPHFVLFGGDMTGGDNAKQWPVWFDDWQHTITPDGRLTPIIVTRGNHEYSNKTLIDLFDAKGIDLFYGFTFGTDLLRVYTLNSLIPSGGKQQQWLAKDLKQNNFVQWKTAQYHHTMRPHTKAKPEKNEQLVNWATLFYKYQVQLAIESDAHVVKMTYPIRPSKGPDSYEGFARDDEKGTVYLGEGCWGAPLRAANDSKPWTRASGSFNQFKWFFVDRNGIEIRTVKTDGADFVQAVDPYNIFTPPSDLNIWAPNGETTFYIRNKNVGSPANYGDFSGNLAARGVSSPMYIDNFATTIIDKDIEVTWQVKEEPLNLYYEVQRAFGNEKYTTIARMQGKCNVSNNSPNYQFRDVGLAIRAQGKYVKYRLKYKTNTGQTSYYHPPVPKLTGEGIESLSSSKQLRTDNNGRLQIKYQLAKDCAVSFQLFNSNRREIFNNQLIDQAAKNYLKSLDISQLPDGKYVLVVKAGQEEIERFQVLKSK